MIKTNTLPQSH